jgi:hypothetical protein
MDTVLTTTSPLTAPDSRTLLWSARVFSGLAVTFLLADAVGKLVAPAPVVEATLHLGFAADVIRPLGIVLGLSTLLYLFPRTRLVGALLLTAYLGGATATHVRSGTPFWFPVVMGAILWTTYYLRSPNLRALFLSPQAR